MTKLPLIQLENISKTYQIGSFSSQVLKNVSLNVQPGELLAIVGASGSGKSTLMNLIGLLDKADRGTYYLNGNAIDGLSADELALFRNEYIGFVFQQFHLLTRFSAWQNVALPLSYRNIPASSIKKLVEDALGKVGMLAFSEHKPMQLSGGQQQRVAIARALVGNPHMILADEPTGALDSKTGAEVMNLFLSLHAEGRTIILVTHDEQIAAQCERNITIADGQIVAERVADVVA